MITMENYFILNSIITVLVLTVDYFINLVKEYKKYGYITVGMIILPSKTLGCTSGLTNTLFYLMLGFATAIFMVFVYLLYVIIIGLINIVDYLKEKSHNDYWVFLNTKVLVDTKRFTAEELER